MTETESFHSDDARSFGIVLGHELYYIDKKRQAGDCQRTPYDYSQYHEFEVLSAELDEAKGRSWLKWGKSKDRSKKTIDRIEHQLSDLRAELNEREDEILNQAANENLLGLALSGGGIRSATFNLGILQSLANFGWLRRLDYLSTVSGGGYIGGWLTALINRENTGENAPDPADRCGRESGIGKVECRIRTRHRSDESVSVEEDGAITFLRRYSNYLTPKTGMLSADTWSAITNYARNVLLNLVILIAVIGGLLLLPRLLAVFFHWLQKPLWLIVFSLALSGFAAIVLGFNLASLLAADSDRDHIQQYKPHGQERLLVLFILPFFLIALLCSIWLPNLYAGGFGIDWLKPSHDWMTAWWEGLSWIVWVGFSYAGLWVMAYVTAEVWRNAPSQNRGVWLRLIVTAFFAGAVGGLLIWLLAAGLAFGNLDLGNPANPLPHILHAKLLLQITFGPPLLLVWVYLLAVIHTGFMSIWLADGQREWLSRLGAWMIIISIGWVAVFGIGLFGPMLFDVFGEYSKIVLTSGWLLTTLGGLLVGRGRSNDESKGSVVRGIVVAVAPYMFAVGFVIAIASGVDSALGWSSQVSQHANSVSEPALQSRMNYQSALDNLKSEQTDGVGFGQVTVAYLQRLGEVQEEPLPIVIWFFGFVIVILVQGKLIDINEFSLHRFYGNRLTRCYLGASVADRDMTAQRFTGFNRSDDVLFSACEQAAEDGECKDVNRRLVIDRPGPLPIVNAAINLVAGDELAWQQRKAASFALTPLYCGFEPGTVARARQSKNISEHGYRPTGKFATNPVPMTLGTAVTISGAAASPNMGYHTTPALAFLLTIFNVRLGRWVGNPRHRRSWTDSGPRFAPLHLLSEVFGLTRSDTQYVYLSDGGHFENLGIYELVKRRCRFIVACDAGADPEFKFEDLGNAIRKCRTDLGADIRVDVSQIRNKTNELSLWHCAMGEVIYDYGGAGEKRGKLLYIKASLTGGEPEDVVNYARNNPSFPHQTTGDQSFDEAQFESYRRLGEHVGDVVLGRCTDEATTNGTINIENAFVRLNHQWYPPLHKGEFFTQHTKTLSSLFDRLRQSKDLVFLDAQMYPEWKFLHGYQTALSGEDREPVIVDRRYADALGLPKEADELRNGFYFCNSLIQLMEDVYFDLDLENDWAHPDNRGWMNLFKHWSWVGMFRVTWAISAATYGRRFQLFCERHLALKLGSVGLAGPFVVRDFAGARDRIFELNSLSPMEVSHTEYAAAVAMLFQNSEKASLNHLELSQLLAYLTQVGKQPGRNVGDYRLYQLQMRVEVPNPRIDAEESTAQGKRLFHFVFGYALLNGGNGIELFRVQDHLRKLGLARHALDRLWREVGELNIRSLADLHAIDSDFTLESRRTFVDLFHSVQRERKER